MKILNSIDVQTMPVWLSFVLMIIACFTGMLVRLAYDEDEVIGAVGFVIITLALLVASFYILWTKKDVRRVYAIIDDTKPFVEVMEEYTVHDRQGEIWVLDKEKEDSL